MFKVGDKVTLTTKCTYNTLKFNMLSDIAVISAISDNEHSEYPIAIEYGNNIYSVAANEIRLVRVIMLGGE